MVNDVKKNYTLLDHPEILQFLFHPRGDFSPPSTENNSKLFSFNVNDEATVGAKFHPAGSNAPTIIFFHGNGEIASDYDDLAPLYIQKGINFFVFDYRGYGTSTGTPTVTSMMNDCHLLFQKALTWLTENNYTGPVIIMGRSLGSASALELAASYADDIDGLIIESGFAWILPLLKLLGGYSNSDITEEHGPMNYEKIKRYSKPTLIIHAEFDHIIPFSDGKTLYENSASPSKRFLEIKGADHNTLLYYGINEYMTAVRNLVSEVS